MEQFLTHVTSSHERWDLLAWTYYGDATLYRYLIEANPTVPIVPKLNPGITLIVPILQIAASNVTPVPPWRQQ